MPNYQKGKIYAIRSNQTDNVYYGSTTLSLCARMGEHRRLYRFHINKDTLKNGCKSYDILKYDDAYIELVEEFPCQTKEQLHKREGEIIRSDSNSINRCIAGRSLNQWRIDNEQHIKDYSRAYETFIRKRDST